MNTMEEGLQEVLTNICAKDEHELTDNDKAILRARRDYIGQNNRKKFAKTLGEKPEAVVEQPKEEGKPEVTTDTSAFPADNTQDDGVDE